MCGIAGYVSTDGRELADARIVESMCNTMIHRGPNDQGVYVEGPVGLGSRRLSIIDLKTGRQPVHNEDGAVWVVFSGAIYNFRDFLRKLEQRGHSYGKTACRCLARSNSVSP